MNDNDNSDFGGMIGGARRLKQDRVNLYPQRRRKSLQYPRAGDSVAHPAGVAPAEPVTARQSHFISGLQKKLQCKNHQGLIRPGSGSARYVYLSAN